MFSRETREACAEHGIDLDEAVGHMKDDIAVWGPGTMRLARAIVSADTGARRSRQNHRTLPEPPPPGLLTSREYEILALLASGADQPKIASIKFLSIHTVSTHIQNAMRKLGARNRTHAVAIALRRGLIPFPE